MNEKELNDELDKIESSLGHYSNIGGVDPPFIKTDDNAIRDSIAKIKTAVKTIVTQLLRI